jgi:twitching motility protein PilT
MGSSSNVNIPMRLQEWLAHAVRAGASDLHLLFGHPPVMRVHGELVDVPAESLSHHAVDELLTRLMPAGGVERFRDGKNLDFSFTFTVDGQPTRFRTNVFSAAGQTGACIRIVPNTIPSLAWAGFPTDLAERLAFLLDGLVIVTGAAGSGKTTTLAMIVNLIHQSGGYRIITIEEPVEYVYPRIVNSVVSQREVGLDVNTFAEGLKFGLRQDPDVMLVGEIRDRETAQIALSASETGHLVFSTLHTRDAKGAISRYADFFPQEVQRDIRHQLALSLRAVIAQRLLPPSEPGARRHLALEVLWNTNPIASAIRTAKLESIDNYLLTGREDGMVSFDESVRQLLQAGKINRTVAEQNVRDVSFLRG